MKAPTVTAAMARNINRIATLTEEEQKEDKIRRVAKKELERVFNEILEVAKVKDKLQRVEVTLGHPVFKDEFMKGISDCGFELFLSEGNLSSGSTLFISWGEEIS